MSSWCLFLLYAVVILCVTSKSKAGVYGIAGPSYKDGEGALVKYDITSGEASTVRVPNRRRPPYTEESLGCLDNVHSVYFFFYEYWSFDGHITALYAYDLLNATEYEPVKLPIASSPMLAGDQCAYDFNTGDIFVFGHDANNDLYQLLLRVRFNRRDGNATVDLIGNYSLINDIPFIVDGVGIYDSYRNTLWLQGDYGNNESTSTIDYFLIDVKTGKLDKKVIWDDVEISNAAYYRRLDQIVGANSAGYNDRGWLQLQMLYADPQTLETVQRFPSFTGTNWILYESVYAMDQFGDILYQIVFANTTNGTLLGHLVGISVKEGSVVSEAQICENDEGSTNTCPWSIQYWNANDEPI